MWYAGEVKEKGRLTFVTIFVTFLINKVAFKMFLAFHIIYNVEQVKES